MDESSYFDASNPCHIRQLHLKLEAFVGAHVGLRSQGMIPAKNVEVKHMQQSQTVRIILNH